MPSSSSSRFFSSLSPFPQTYAAPTRRSCVLHGRRLWVVTDALSLDGPANKCPRRLQAASSRRCRHSRRPMRPQRGGVASSMAAAFGLSLALSRSMDPPTNALVVFKPLLLVAIALPQTYAGPNAAELSIKAPYEALIQTASGFETKLSAI